MPITGEHGEIDTINCTFGGESLVTVTVGEIVAIEAGEMFPVKDRFKFPDNCPRAPRYDAGKAIGCITCAIADITFVDGTVVSPF